MLCLVGGIAVFAEFERQADEWGHVQHGFYAGPISKIEQPFRVPHDYLSRIDIWAYIDGDGAAGDVIARVIPHGSDAPIRESRFSVSHPSNAGAPITIRFAPIPDSRDMLYILELTVLSIPPPFVFIGITSSDVHAAGQVSINGDDSRGHLDLAMRPYWVGRGGRVLEHLIRTDPRRLFLIVDAMLLGLLIIFAVAAVWGVHPSGHQRSAIWRAVPRSVLITACIATCTLTLFLVLSAVPHS